MSQLSAVDRPLRAFRDAFGSLVPPVRPPVTLDCTPNPTALAGDCAVTRPVDTVDCPHRPQLDLGRNSAIEYRVDDRPTRWYDCSRVAERIGETDGRFHVPDYRAN